MKSLIIAAGITVFMTMNGWAADDAPTALTNKEAIDLVQTHANYLWTLVAACLVFFMQAGFAMVEAGFTRAKNAINIMMKISWIFPWVPWLIGHRFRAYVWNKQKWFSGHNWFLLK